LKRKSEDGSLVFPRPDRPDIVDLVRVIARALEVPGIDTRPAADSISKWIGQPEHIVFLLLDGLGVNIVQKLPADSFLASHMKAELLSVVPSTTASALAALGTAVYPNQHAVPGWFTYLPDYEITTTILPFIERYTEIPLQERGITGPDVFTQPSWMPRIPGDVVVIQPQQYYDGIFAKFMRGDTLGRGYETLRQASDAVVEHVSQARSKSFALLYLPQLDTLSHVVGPMHEEVLAMAITLDAELSRLTDLLEGKARLIISADHGQILVPHDNQIELFDGDLLIDLLEIPPTGEGRLPLFHVRDHNRDIFESIFEDRFGDRFVLMSIEEAQEISLFGLGPMSPVSRSRFGQYCAIPLEDHTLAYLPPSIPPRSSPIGRHGALSPAEMLVPLIVA
jgi:hypothetical protein